MLDALWGALCAVMSGQKWFAIILAVLTFSGSVAGSAAIAGRFVGSIETRVAAIENGLAGHANLSGHPDIRELIASLTEKIEALSRDVQRLERTIERERRQRSEP